MWFGALGGGRGDGGRGREGGSWCLSNASGGTAQIGTSGSENNLAGERNRQRAWMQHNTRLFGTVITCSLHSK